SRASPRERAASMAIEMFSLTRFWPMYSSRRLGRTLASRRASSSIAAPETMREGRAGSFLGRMLGIGETISDISYQISEGSDQSSATNDQETRRRLASWFPDS